MHSCHIKWPIKQGGVCVYIYIYSYIYYTYYILCVYMLILILYDLVAVVNMCWMSAQTTAINVLSLLWARSGLVPHDKGAWIPSGNSALGTLQRVLLAIGLQGSYFFAIKTTPGQEFERFFLASSPGFTDLEYLHNAILEYLRSSWTTLEFS